MANNLKEALLAMFEAGKLDQFAGDRKEELRKLVENSTVEELKKIFTGDDSFFTQALSHAIVQSHAENSIFNSGWSKLLEAGRTSKRDVTGLEFLGVVLPPPKAEEEISKNQQAYNTELPLSGLKLGLKVPTLGEVIKINEGDIGPRIFKLPSGRTVTLTNVSYAALSELHDLKLGVRLGHQRPSGSLGDTDLLCEPGIQIASKARQEMFDGNLFGKATAKIVKTGQIREFLKSKGLTPSQVKKAMEVLGDGEIDIMTVNLEDFNFVYGPTPEEEEARKRAVAKRHRQIHSNSGFSNSWLRRLNQELEKLGKDLTNRKLVKFIMDNCKLYPTWDDIVEGIKFYINADESCKEAMRKYRKKAKKLGKTIKQ